MARSGTVRWRNLLVGLHVITSVGWMALALVLVVLLTHGMRTGDAHAYRMADLLDDDLLLHLANASAFTGLMLAGLTRWGYTRHWWVTTKFAMTLSQLYVGIFILGGHLDRLAAGLQRSATGVAVATVLMAGALAFQTWLSIAKPWRLTPWTTGKAGPKPPDWLFAAALAVPVIDYSTATFVFGHPAPLLTVLTVIGYPIWRAARARPATAGDPIR
ncbi:hypothetical protein [Nonomuraea gerenzanensis]|uniref:Integral membrane protein n=1 Tax=Nonomuraea gerenzanensis TaxID=93944 RepID=A0A1M4EAX8_9ACTN|nr:hypothetical protein [Nonomuraea gerenzanensis]UBU18239.1 hypothetical protein LCN96_25400 [Nonomuraea gerenzanensis]SBO96055.1 hypothetical protein BN4615_P5571 [Nonomuraea gerenzanensis]